MPLRLFALGSLCTALSLQAPASPGNVVTEWAAIVQPAIQSGRPPASAQVLHAMVALAIYDAAVAVEGRFEPYIRGISRQPDADIRAAVAAAAWRTARARLDSPQVSLLDTAYRSYMERIPDGRSTREGIRLGEAVGTALLTLRADDGYGAMPVYPCAEPAAAGEFQPAQGCQTRPVDLKLASVRPYTFEDPGRFPCEAPHVLSSREYASDFEETRVMGHRTSTRRTPGQTDLVYFWSEHTYAHWNRNLIDLATVRTLDTLDTARLFALAHTASADAILAGFNAKYRFRSWRPMAAIRRADEDGNPDTRSDPDWTPLLAVNHPEHPSAHAFWSAALTEGVAAFFGTRAVRWTLRTDRAVVPQLMEAEREYGDVDAVMRDIENARVWAGLHWRHSMRAGARLGETVAAHVVAHHFAGRDGEASHSREPPPGGCRDLGHYGRAAAAAPMGPLTPVPWLLRLR